WVLSTNNELMFWVPPDNRAAFYLPQNTLIIGGEPTQFLYEHFVHGNNWVKCYSHYVG
ncbi:hypothetical protein GGX14DRAFT_353533, partial [Mycena pura]